MLVVVSGYSLQVGQSKNVKDKFWDEMSVLLFMLGGNLNSHVNKHEQRHKDAHD